MARDQDDVDARFQALIRDAFGEQVDPKPIPNTPSGPAATSAREPFNLAEALDRADPEPDPWDRFVAPDPGPLQLPRRPRAFLGSALLVQMLVVLALILAGVPLQAWVGSVSALLAAAGLLLLLLSVPRHRDDDDNGARV